MSPTTVYEHVLVQEDWEVGEDYQVEFTPSAHTHYLRRRRRQLPGRRLRGRRDPRCASGRRARSAADAPSHHRSRYARDRTGRPGCRRVGPEVGIPDLMGNEVSLADFGEQGSTALLESGMWLLPGYSPRPP